LEAVLQCLEKQNYPAGLFEVILVNDWSADKSFDIATAYCSKNENFRLINNKDGKFGKKEAVNYGIQQARHDLIVTTDADCTMSENWLASYSSFQSKNNADLIIGLVDMDSGTGILGKFQETEFLSLIASGAGAAAYGKPLFCNAANMAFKKSSLAPEGDRRGRKTVSGDDTFLLHAFKKKHKKILLLKSGESLVKTNPLPSWSLYINQRRRWLSKARYYNDTSTVYTGLLVLMLNLAWITGFLLLVAGINFWLLPVIFAVKTFADVFLLDALFRFLGKKCNKFTIMLLEAFYPFFIVWVVISGWCKGFSWKERGYGRTGLPKHF